MRSAANCPHCSSDRWYHLFTYRGKHTYPCGGPFGRHAPRAARVLRAPSLPEETRANLSRRGTPRTTWDGPNGNVPAPPSARGAVGRLVRMPGTWRRIHTSRCGAPFGRHAPRAARVLRAPSRHEEVRPEQRGTVPTAMYPRRPRRVALWGDLFTAPYLLGAWRCGAACSQSLPTRHLVLTVRRPVLSNRRHAKNRLPRTP